jgi:ABC-type sugar transport system permease subunit
MKIRQSVPFWFTLPAVIVYTALLIAPIFIALGVSFTQWNGITPARFVGFNNFIRLFSDKRLGSAVLNTLAISAVYIIAVNALGLAFALLINKQGRLSNGFRAAFFCPYVLSSVAVSFIWRNIFSYSGLINSFLSAIGLDALVGNYLGVKESALMCIAIVEIWRGIGFYMVIYLAALQIVPVELYEACTIDGGNARHKFFSVTLPMIIPGVSVAVVMSIINILRLYDSVKIMTDGGPGYDTETIVYNIVAQGFTNMNVGYSSAIAVVLFIVIAGITIALTRLSSSLEVEA